MLEPEEIIIPSSYGNVSASLYLANDMETLVVINSATGVKQEYYQKFASFLQSHHITVLSYDYIGIGRSLNGRIKELQNCVLNWAQDDCEAVLQYAISRFPNAQKVLLGHSIGGQIIGLSPSSLKMDRLVLVAAQSGYWRYWSGFSRYRMWFNWYVLFPAVIGVFGYLNSKRISGMENLPKGVAHQWRYWCKQPNYFLDDRRIEKMFFDEYQNEIKSFSIDDDAFAPRPAVEWLNQLFTQAKLEPQHLSPADYNVSKIGHFGIFKEEFRDKLWPDLLKAIKQ